MCLCVPSNNFSGVAELLGVAKRSHKACCERAELWSVTKLVDFYGKIAC